MKVSTVRRMAESWAGIREAAPSTAGLRATVFPAVAFLIPAFLITAVLTTAQTPPLRAQPHSFAPIVKAQRAKVVHINTRSAVARKGEPDSPLPYGFPEPSKGTGSGFIISADGYIVTNHHVVEASAEIEVVLDNGKKYPAEIIGLDPQTDLALIKIEARNLPRVIFGDSGDVEVGDWVIAIGNPLGLDHSVTAGIISAKGRNIFREDNLAYGEFLQTDAAINPGNSGGPLFDLDGKVVGVNSAISRKGQGIGFAVASNLVVEIVRQLREHGRVIRGWIGIVIQEITAEISASLSLPAGTLGVLVDEILPASPAREGGLKPGDVMTGFAGKPLRKVAQLQKLVALTAPGNPVEVVGLRRASGEEEWRPLKITIQIGHNPRSANAGKPSLLTRLGVVVLNIPPTLRKKIPLGQSAGVLVESVAPGGIGEELGLRAGDIILEAARQEVGSREALETALLQASTARISLVVRRKDKILYLVLSRSDLGR